MASSTARTCILAEQTCAARRLRPIRVKGRVCSLYGLLIVLNAGAWIWALLAFRTYPILLGTAFLAYTLGLRHAVDADHIAAIDNVTRKLMQEGRQPVTIGLLFSLGHSTVVFGLSVLIALTSVTLQRHFASFESVGGLIGTSVSAFFLFALAVGNLIILLSVYRTFRRVRAGGRYNDEDLDLLLAQRGFISRLFRRLFRLIERSWQMYLVGFLFGLGFDTATEVGLLGISAAEAAKGLSVLAILVFPTLFAAAMALVDSTDNVVMLGAYGWAFDKPIRKLYYNLTITSVSVVVAFLIGGIEVLGLIGHQLKIHGALWKTVGTLDDHFGVIGLVIVGVLLISWSVSILIYRLNRFDAIEVKVGRAN